MTFKNLKIAITDETHLKAVCEVLATLGYKKAESIPYDDSDEFKNCCSHVNGVYAYYCHNLAGYYETVTLNNLLKMRDDMVKANAKSR